jgi:phosphoglycolate phosphatase
MPDSQIKPISAYRHIVWDWNGTLLDDTSLCAGIINRMLAERGLPTLSIYQHRKTFDFPVIRFYERAGFDLKSETFEELSVQFIDEYYARVGECRMQEGAQTFLEQISARGLSQSILSASRQDQLETQVSRYNIRHYFDAIHGIETIYATSKTARGQAWLEQSGMAAEEILMIGDTVHDYEVSQALGIDCCLISWGAHPPEKLIATRAPVFGDLGEVGRSFASHLSFDALGEYC